MNKPLRFLLLVFVLAFAGACATPQPGSMPTGNPGALVEQLEAALTSARSNQVDVLAPGLFNDAQSAFMKAKQGLDKGTKLTDIQEYVAQGSASLKKAEEIAQVSRTILGETNKARDKALKVGADRLGEPYMDVEKRYLKLTKAIENDNLSYAQKNAVEVQAAFRDVEIMAIKNSAIGNARKMMADANKARVQKIAPAAYNDALQALNEADAYIGQNPYEADTISQKAAHAEFMARRMMSIDESSNKFKEMTPEASALYVEGLLVRLEKTMDTGDLRDQGIDGQLNGMIGSVDSLTQKNQSLETDNQAYQARIADLEKQFTGLQGYSREQETAKRKLAAEREFNEKFNKVQRFFRPDEAEVYKQGGQLVIRMRGIQFPVGQATLTPDNYTLLSKVQQAIVTFGQPTVTIEGHTDSTGSAQMNQELSQNRAEAVKTYLVANKTLPANRIRATGYGPSRPLAPETTPEGRAMNRRIDVLITPSQTP
ncbi:OmpA family protein [Desulfosarcina sp.]|uniref:OmpA family protein n=1 Tax=Desulfosarcina sp. TaxID=2027861 RepID=UPI0029A99419|nr:OmpA family protein [Desulfosarcina sp.]MDX2451906.1 OmpA family protein [Desulfosarcina sp.]MDX2489696.1 OmpA family protein [Desulfosarcina sp.]